MRRWMLLGVVAALAGCSWPPSLSAPPVAPNPAQSAEQTSDQAGQAVRPPQVPALPALSAPSVSGSPGGLLGR